VYNVDQVIIAISEIFMSGRSMDVPLKFRSFVTGKKISFLAIIFLFLVQYVGSSTVTFSDEISLKERQHLQALQLRENSKAKAQSQLGYENVYGDL
jgi:hypothetical protein